VHSFTLVYLSEFLPNAANVAQQLRESGKEARLVFMLQSYIVSLFLSCPQVSNIVPSPSSPVFVITGGLVHAHTPHRAWVWTVLVQMTSRSSPRRCSRGEY